MFSNWELVDINNWVSDIMLAFCLIYWASKLKLLPAFDEFTKTWSKFFLLIGISAFIGGWGHMLVQYMGHTGVILSWELSILAVLSLEIGLLITDNTPQYWLYLLLLKAVVLGACTLYFADFMWVKIYMSSGIIGIVIPLLIKNYRLTEIKGFLIMMGGLLANGLSGAIHSLNIKLAAFCDHRDLAHFVSICCFGIVFNGIKKVNSEKVKMDIDEKTEVSLV